MKKAIIAVAVLLAGVFVLVAYSGLFRSVEVSERSIGPFTMVLKAHRGSYYETQKIFKEVNDSLAKAIDTKKLKGVGIYYDDPAKVKKEDLRSECGYIVDERDLGKIIPLKNGLIIREFKETRCVTGEFPIKTFLSYVFGPSKAYPKLSRHLEEKKYTADYAIEIYDMQSRVITYGMPLVKK
jgi:hypothetical protein